MNTKKIFAVILALAMVFAMTAGAFAAGEATLDENGEAGAFETADTAESQSKQLILTKVLRAFNESEADSRTDNQLCLYNHSCYSGRRYYRDGRS